MVAKFGRRAAACALLAALCVACGAAWAHRLAPAGLRVTIAADGEATAVWRVARERPAGEVASVVWPVGCAVETTRGPALADGDGDAVETTLRVACGADGWAGRTLAVSGLVDGGTTVVVSVAWPDGGAQRALLSATEPAVVLSPASEAGVFWRYVGLGVTHLWSGLDHVLLVLGALLLLRGWALVRALTAFTVGHSVTLALATLGVVRVPQAWAELAIAATLVWLAYEAVTRGGTSGTRGAGRAWWAFAGIGLVHGLGFAGALADTGVPDGAVAVGLAAFNLGVEVGQLGIVGAAAAVAWAARRLGAGERAARASTAWVAHGIGALGVCWLLERSVLLWG